MGTKHRYPFLLALLCGLLWVSPALAETEPLRLLIPFFFGPTPLSQHVRTTINFEIIKAFRAVDAPEKGAWILYGQEALPQPTHDAVLSAAAWPSVRADLVIWGQVYKYDDGVVVQLYLTLTPLIKKRQVRPELWTLTLKDGRDQPVRLELDIPGQFYQFEPMLLAPEAILAFADPQGMPLYSDRQGGEVIGRVGEVMQFLEIHDDTLLIASGDLQGWVRTVPLSRQRSEAIDFSEGMVRLLRGDWGGRARVLALYWRIPVCHRVCGFTR